MIRFLHGRHYDFIKWRRWAIAMTAAFIAIGVVSIAWKGVNYNIEFTGGTLMQLEFARPPGAADLRSTLQAGGIRSAEIQQFGSPTEYTVRAQDRVTIQGLEQGAERVSRRIEQVVVARYGADGVRIVRTEAIGPRVGAELRRGAITAMLISFAITMIYLAVRFEWRFGLATILATMHDIVATLAFIKLMNIEISLTVVAALLTVVGYSMNDTIVIFDRVRENLRKRTNETLYDILNRSINETLPRTVMTGMTTLGCLLALIFFGGAVIRPFAWVLTFGIIVGTFSSIYVASPILLWIERRWPRAPATRAGGAGTRRRLEEAAGRAATRHTPEPAARGVRR
jgi:preprotein translocase subunit SecF